jgi:hypothetical protein
VRSPLQRSIGGADEASSPQLPVGVTLWMGFAPKPQAAALFRS